MTVGLLLDEHFSLTIAQSLRDKGIDTVAAVAEPGLRGLDDRMLLMWAAEEGYGVVTENVVDFMGLHEEFVARGRSHSGIVFTSSRSFPRHPRGFGRLINALQRLSAEGLPQPSTVTWL